MPSADPPLRIGIVGAGPGGLGAAIFLSRLDNVHIKVYEQATDLREVGAGIHLHGNTFRMLELAGARDAIDRLGSSETAGQAAFAQHRNGITDELLKEIDWTKAGRNEKPVRCERTTLQKALLEQVPPGLITLKKKLVGLEKTETGTRVEFADGTSDEVDLLIGADGIRSVVRSLAFPNHSLAYTGQTAWRTLFPYDLVKEIPNLPDATVFFHGPKAHVFTTQVGNGKFEVSVRAFVPFDGQVTWGVPVKKSDFIQYYEGFSPVVRAILDAAPEDNWKQFAMFSGPELTSLTEDDNIVLIGDASHPLAGAFGAGAGFALEDGYVLALAIDAARERNQPIAWALDLFNQTRLPHYSAMYANLAAGAAARKAVPDGLSEDELLRRTVGKAFGSTDWIYEYDADREWGAVLAKADSKIRGQ